MDRQSFQELMAMSTVDADGDIDLSIGLDSLTGLEQQLKKLSLAQIGYLFLSQIAEANHGSWDSVPREELIGINNFFEDMIIAADYDQIESKTDLSLSFGGQERWDAQGNRTVR